MRRRIRLAQVLETIHLGGVEQRVRTVVRGLDSDRFEHLVICTRAAGDIPNQLVEAGARLVEVGKFRARIDPYAIARAYRAILEFGPDIIHGGVIEGVVMGVAAGKLAGVPVIISEETSDAFGRRPTGHLLARSLYRLSDCTIGVSPFVERYLLQKLGLPRKAVQMIANAVASPLPNNEMLGANIRREFNIGAETLLFGTLGRLSDFHKGTSDAIRGLASLDPDLEAQLLIVGIGPDEEMLRNLASVLGVANRVHFAGYRSDPYPLLAAMNVFLHPARFEAFGMVIAEAMFAGLPVIATPVGGIPDVVDDGSTAILVPPCDVLALSQAMNRMAGDPSLRRHLGEAGRKRAARHFGEERYLEEIETLYSGLLERKSR